jgi:DtxR family Mn-dependent transcriptional regulator
MWNIHPIVALTVFAIILIILIVIFYPKWGLISRYKKVTKNTQRVFMEDALKHLYDYESHGLVATLNSIAGNLSITVDKTSKIVENLKNLKLVFLEQQKISLSKEGRAYALRVIRIHRLWESYLAEETGVKELDWHDEAEEVEHILSQEAANELSAKIGNPKFDPHGDPIPTQDGQVFFRKGDLLNNVEVGQVVKIIHIEDEPKSIYIKLLDQGFHPGKKIKILDKENDNLVIAIDGDEKELECLFASKLTVQVINDLEFVNEKVKTLADIGLGEVAEVVTIANNCRGQQRRRLLDFGIVPGAKVSIHMKNPLNDPTAYSVKDTIVALRKIQAKKIIIKNFEQV